MVIKKSVTNTCPRLFIQLMVRISMIWLVGYKSEVLETLEGLIVM